MRQTVDNLEEAGLVKRQPHPKYERRALVTITRGGKASLDEDRRHRDHWLAVALEEELNRRERQQLSRVLPLLGRIADGERSDAPS